MVEELEIRAEQVAAHPTDPSKVIVTIKTKSVSMHHIIELELALRGASSGTVLCSVSEQGPSLTTLSRTWNVPKGAPDIYYVCQVFTGKGK